MTIIRVRGKQLYPQQLAAATTGSPTCLVLAGAGTGKTTTLVGRVKHLISEGADPSRILVISLTNNTVDDIRSVISGEFDGECPVDVRTIHALGRAITGGRVCVGWERDALITRIIDQLLENESFASGMRSWLTRYHDTSLGDLGYCGLVISDMSMRWVADALFKRRIRFTYTAGGYSGGGYVKPVLTVPEAEVVLDPDSKELQNLTPSAAENLVERMFPESVPMSDAEFCHEVIRSWGPRIPESFGANISRCKLTGLNPSVLRGRIDRVQSSKRADTLKRLDVLEKIWHAYLKAYTDAGVRDFDDMVVDATGIVRSGRSRFKTYDHVLIDEYQDASSAMSSLISAMRDAHPFDLFCVGDDWQSIYAFSGSDVWQMYDFEKQWSRFGKVSVTRVEKTFRYSQDIADIAGKFVMKNDVQMRKRITCSNARRDSLQMLPVAGDRDIPFMIANRLEHLPQGDSVFVIGRRRADIHILCSNERFVSGKEDAGSASVLFMSRDEYSNSLIPDREIMFTTAHSSKGLEADWVFIMGDTTRGGFPVYSSDPFDALFDSREEPVDLAEERRVFYVALTRARKGVFLINKVDETKDALSCDSDFIDEIIEDNTTYMLRNTPVCPECGGAMMIRSSSRGLFYGCKAYPDCRGTDSIKTGPFR